MHGAEFDLFDLDLGLWWWRSSQRKLVPVAERRLRDMESIDVYTLKKRDVA